jgi:quinol-cytochrome oxidoreductase complex cytochrome b subunit
MTPSALIARLFESRLWRSVFRHGWPDNPDDRSQAMTTSLFLHVHPARVSRKSLRWSYSFGLGIIAITLFGMLVCTGVLMMFYYVPSVERAYQSVRELRVSVSFGNFIRNVHRWSAHGMVLIVILHMARVFYTGAYKPPREFTWVIGVVLLLLTFGASYTGYLLPWDQLAYWGTTVGTTIASYEPFAGPVIRELLLGGPEVGQSSLTRFFTLHVAVLPILLTLVLSLHLWRVRTSGGLAANESEREAD